MNIEHNSIEVGEKVYSKPVDTTILQQIFTFSTIINTLKDIERFKGQFYWRDYPDLQRYQSVADHTWRLTLLVVLFHDILSRPIDLNKALKMALIHDIVEAIEGDDSPIGEDGTGRESHSYNQTVAEKRSQSHEQAAREIFATLPQPKAEELFVLWKSVEEQNCFEAKVIKSLDKIEALLQVLEYRSGHMFQEHLNFTLQYNVRGSEVDPAIHAFGELISDELQRTFKKYSTED